jgi:serine/threonine protein kinase
MGNLLGQQIGRYQILDVIGQGGMGIVYRAFDPPMNRSVAIKMLNATYTDEKAREQFFREASLTASLDHNNIVTVFSLEEYQGSPYLVMQYLEGQSMAEMISSRRPLHIVDKIGLVSQVCDGLQYAHERNVIHRDIKPANVLVLKDSVAKIVDFGIARATKSETFTQTGQVRGSLPYMSPEQLSGLALDFRTDIYSAGVMLFQFLTGELPFPIVESDLNATITKILKEPTPSLGKYLSDYPAVLDQIIGRATAKSADARYQSAEDFGYDLARLQDSLKREMTAEYLARAKASIERKDWESARQQLQELLKTDRRNPEAADLLQVVREEFRRQQRSVQIAQLRTQAHAATQAGKFEEALECIEQALRLNPSDSELVALSQSVKDRIERERKLADALRQGHAALYAGDLHDAVIAVQKALKIDQNHTEARALESLIEKEQAERARRAQYQGLLEGARHEISSRNFLSALNFLKKAQAIDPSDTNIRELINWAAKGYEEEKRRKEIEDWTNTIGQMLREGHCEKALESCHTALEKFPEQTSLLKLEQLAKHQFDLISRRRALDEASATARKFVDAEKFEEALTLLDGALQSFPGDPNLETLLAITRSELERRREAEQERKRFQQAEQAAMGLPDKAAGAKQSQLDHLKALQQGLSRQLPLSQLRTLAAKVADIVATEGLATDESVQYASALDEFRLREKKRQADCAELERLASSVKELKAPSEIDAVLRRASAITEAYSKDEEIRAQFADVRRIANEVRLQHDAVTSQISELLRSMQMEQSSANLLILKQQIEDIATPWLGDDGIRTLANQASAHVNEFQQHTASLLQELGQLENSIRTARSAGQIRLLLEQSKLLTDSEEGDVRKAISALQVVAENKLRQLEETIVKLRTLAASATSAPTLEEAESYGTLARNLASDSESVEADNLLKTIEHGIAERKKEYRRISNNFERLIEGAGQANETAELDLILARQRDLAKKYSQETCFRELEARLNSSVNERREHLDEMMRLEEEATAAKEAEDNDEAAGTATTAFSPQSNAAPVVALPSRSEARAAISSETSARNLLLKIAVPAVLVAGIMAAIMMFRPGQRVTFNINPIGAMITVDGNPCTSPCVLKLSRGTHEVAATKPGFKDFSKTFAVPLSGGELPPIAMMPIPPGPGSVDSGGKTSTLAEILVKAGLADVSVLLDGKLAGQTTAKGDLSLQSLPGAHELKVEKPGYKTTSTKVHVTANASVIVPFTLAPLPMDGSSPPPVQPPSGKLSVDSSRVTTGQQVTLTWQTVNATDVSIQGLGPVLPNGTRQVRIDAATTFQLLAKGPGGTASESVHVEVTSPASPQPVPVASIKANPEKITAGQTVTLTWQTQNANDVSIDGIGPVTPNGTKQITLSQSTKFPLIAKGAGGTGTDIVLVEVVVPVLPKPPNGPGPTLVDPDREGIKAAINRYKEAYQSESLDDMKRVWPGISKDQQKSLKDTFNMFNAIRLEMPCREEDLHITGDEASVDCRAAFTYTMHGQKQPLQTATMHIGLRKEAGTWTIASVTGH